MVRRQSRARIGLAGVAFARRVARQLLRTCREGLSRYNVDIKCLAVDTLVGWLLGKLALYYVAGAVAQKQWLIVVYFSGPHLCTCVASSESITSSGRQVYCAHSHRHLSSNSGIGSQADQLGDHSVRVQACIVC